MWVEEGRGEGGRGRGVKHACNGFQTFGVLGLPPGVSFPHTPRMTGRAVRFLSYIPSRKRKEESEKREGCESACLNV